MQLNAIRRLNVVLMALLIGSLVTMFGGIIFAALLNSRGDFAFTFIAGWITMLMALMLSFVVDRVKFPSCGKPFNRPNYGNWFARQFARTQPRWTCADCGHGGSMSYGSSNSD